MAYGWVYHVHYTKENTCAGQASRFPRKKATWILTTVQLNHQGAQNHVNSLRSWNEWLISTGPWTVWGRRTWTNRLPGELCVAEHSSSWPAHAGRQSTHGRSPSKRSNGVIRTGWWFGFFIFPYIGNNHPIWRIFFRWVGIPPTNYGFFEWIVKYQLEQSLPKVTYRHPSDMTNSANPSNQVGPIFQSKAALVVLEPWMAAIQLATRPSRLSSQIFQGN